MADTHVVQSHIPVLLITADSVLLVMYTPSGAYPVRQKHAKDCSTMGTNVMVVLCSVSLCEHKFLFP